MENILPWETTVRWMETQLPLLERIAILLVYFWVAVLLPMSMFRKAHMAIVRSLRISAWYMGALCCWFSAIVAYHITGSSIEEERDNLQLLLVGVGLILIARIAAKLILRRGERARLIHIRHYYAEE